MSHCYMECLSGPLMTGFSWPSKIPTMPLCYPHRWMFCESNLIQNAANYVLFQLLQVVVCILHAQWELLASRNSFCCKPSIYFLQVSVRRILILILVCKKDWYWLLKFYHLHKCFLFTFQRYYHMILQHGHCCSICKQCLIIPCYQEGCYCMTKLISIHLL